ncbi:MAG: phage baseplate assembly protein V [Methylococcales bacterium]
MSCNEPFLGKFRGTVVQNNDPKKIGRVQVIVPDVSNVMLTSWAMPCLPISGIQSGLFAIPPLGSGVWVEFEQGDPDYPIWVGGWWGSAAEMAPTALASPSKTPNVVLQSVGQNSITVFGAPGGGITLSSGPVANAASPKITITSAAIVISDGVGSITLAKGIVDINKGALTITPT